MSGAIRDTIKKRGRPATGAGQQVQVRLQPDMLAALDKFASEEQGFNRPTTIRLILRDWLIGHGYLPPEK